MSELRELYQEMILDHGRHPRNCHVLANANRQAEGFNQLCGDRLTIYLNVENNTIKDISFTGSGCAICMASASLMSETLKGKTEQEAQVFFQNFHELLTHEKEPTHAMPSFNKLSVFSGVKAYPARVKCATLAWHTLQAGLQQQKTSVSTEN
ncbi:Fe-S cluster assembly sulfur transfer protein SufU [Rickettsiella endosymbiont of Dermanyssus gallinae]|uniref:Fe-S cluster assembly sulfur transfer protein SufU n=1 Tax=Rickettsiella endosymbiont of Dermanyssus gallinae TaxID=2856608 RepID=UPI001C5301C6|nr:SUF system NifU family Fe-S cluster assembly protein [Rickettsiella endosymbiont of Dermanyssus gallinae]